MSRRFPIFLACLSIAVSAAAAPLDIPAPGAAARGGGILLLRLQWDGGTPMPAGVLISCRARVLPLSPGGSWQPAEAWVVASGPGRQCALEIPLAWQGSAAPAAVEVIYELDAVSAGRTVARRTGSITAAVPAANDVPLRLTISM
ncbi:MAG: hypothetical protein WCF17_20215 [Terracidiphilus sp.]